MAVPPTNAVTSTWWQNTMQMGITNYMSTASSVTSTASSSITSTTPSGTVGYIRRYLSSNSMFEDDHAVSEGERMRLAIEYARRQGHLFLQRSRRAVYPGIRAMRMLSGDDMNVVVPVRTLDGFELKDKGSYILPDGTVLAIDDDGNVLIDDSEAKVVYRANRVREFNPYINASDLLEAFIREVGSMGVRQSEVLHLPVGAFINWVILQAAKKDGDPTDDLPTVQSALPAPTAPAPRIIPRCLSCGRFVPRAFVANGINFCNPEHMVKHANDKLPGLGRAHSMRTDGGRLRVLQHRVAAAAGVDGRSVRRDAQGRSVPVVARGA